MRKIDIVDDLPAIVKYEQRKIIGISNAELSIDNYSHGSVATGIDRFDARFIMVDLANRYLVCFDQ
jgi:hypothetical protein